MKKVLITFLALLSLLYAAIASATGTPQRIVDARASVVPIEIYTDSGELAGTASGFAIGRPGQPVEYIITNDHVGGNADEYCVVYSGNYIATETTLAFTLPEADLCVLKLETPIHGMEPLLLSEIEPDLLVGGRVYALGFPASADHIFSKGKNTASDVTITDGIVSAVRNAPYLPGKRNITQLQINAAISSGNSGGPLLNNAGLVVGVNTFASLEDSNMNGAVAIDELFSALDQNNIAYQRRSSSFQLHIWMVAPIAAGALLVVFLLLWRNKKRKQAGEQAAKQAVKRIPLTDYLGKNSPMPLDMAVYLLLAVFQKAQQAEQQGQSLLCVYPANMEVLPENGRAVLSKAEHIDIMDGYSAPEQYKQSGQIGGWTVVYQLGALLYHALTGRPLPDVMTRYEDDGAAGNAIQALSISDEKKEALQKAIQLKSSERYMRVSDMMAALDMRDMPVLEIEQAAAPAKAVVLAKPSATKPKPELSKKKRRMIAVAASLLIVIGTTGALAGLSIDGWNRSVALLEQHNFVEASAILTKLPGFLFPNHGEMLALAEAGLAYENGEYDVALEKFQALEGSFAVAQAMVEISAERLREQKIQALLFEVEALIAEGNISEAVSLCDAYLSAPNTTEIIRNEVIYGRAVIYYEYGYFDFAIDIMERLGNYKESIYILSNSIIGKASQKIAQEDYLEAYKICERYPNYTKVEDWMETLIPDLYSQGVDYFENNILLLAEHCFNRTKDYLDTQHYLSILHATTVFDLIPYLGIPYVDDKVHNTPMINTFLLDNWSGNGYYFNVTGEKSGYIELYHYNTNLPRLADGLFLLITDGMVSDAFTIHIISQNIIEIYVYNNGRTYRMTRQ